MEKQAVAKVSELWVYPVKWMQGIKMPELSLSSISAAGDRKAWFTEIGSTNSPTFVDSIKFPGLLKYSTEFENPEDPKNSDIIVTSPKGEKFSIKDPKLTKIIAEESNRNITLVMTGRAGYHSMPISLMSLSSNKAIEELTNIKVDIRRFRQNIYIETLSKKPFEEDNWLGRILVLGDEADSAIIAVVKLDKRCRTINFDPETAEEERSILKAVAGKRENKLGVYCTIIKEGIVRSSSTIYLADPFK